MKKSVNKIVISTLTAAFLVGCGGGSSSTSSTSTSATGGAQKGPFKAGQTVSAQKLLNTGADDQSVSAITTTTDSLGKFQFSSIPWSGPTEFKVEGEYLDESTGQYVPGGLLTAVTNVEAGTAPKVNINILTHIAAKNIKEQMANNVSIDEAKQKAKEVVSKVFKIDLSSDTKLEDLDITQGNDDTNKVANTQLLKISAALTKTDDPAKALDNLVEDLKDGEVDDEAEATFEQLKQKQAEVKLDEVAQNIKSAIQSDDLSALNDLPSNDDLLAGTISLNNNIIFSDILEAEANTSYDSNLVTVSGIYGNGGANISITGGEFSINNNAFNSSSTTINNGDTLQIRATSSSSFDTKTSTIVTIGGVSFDFDIVTKNDPSIIADTKIKAFDFISKTAQNLGTLVESDVVTIDGINTATAISVDTGTEYSISTDNGVNWSAWSSTAGTVENGNQLKVRHTTSNEYSARVKSIVTFGSGENEVVAEFKSYTQAQDKTPDTFSLATKYDTLLSTQETPLNIEFDPITIVGITGNVDVKVDNGEFSKDNGANWSSSGVITDSTQILLRHKASTSHNSKTTSRLIIGTKIAEFISYTKVEDEAEDFMPKEFRFDPKFEQNTNSDIESSSVSIEGLSDGSNAVIEVEDGEYSINDGEYTSLKGTISNGDTLKVRHKSSTKNLEKTETKVKVGEFETKFVSFTKAPVDTVPNPFGFEILNSQELSTQVSSSLIYVRGINTQTDISVENGEISINGSSSWITSGSVEDNDTIRVRHTTSDKNSEKVESVLTIGNDTDGKYTTKFVSVTKKAAPQFTQGDIPIEVDSGSLYSFTPNVTGAKEFEIENKPSWAVFNSRTGQLSGTPNKKEYEKTYENIIIKAENDGGEVELTPFSITVNNIAPKVTLSSKSFTKSIYNDLAIDVTIDDTQGETFTYELVDAPSFVTIDSSTGKISGTNLVVGTYLFKVKVTDSSDASVEETISLSVVEYSDVPTKPEISGKPNSSVNEDETYSFTPNASDINSNNLTFKIENKPSWANFDDKTGTLSGTPLNDDVGTYENIIISVTEATDTVSLTAFSIEVVNTNDAPTTTVSSVSLNSTTNSSVSGNLVANDIDVADVLTYHVVQQPNYGTVEIDNNGKFTYTLTNLQYLGLDTFSFKVNDKTVDSNVSTVSINITDGSVSLNSDVDSAIKILESIDPEIENIDSKLASAKDLLNGNTTAEAKIVSLMIQTAEILNDPDIAALMLIENDSSLDDTSMLNKVVRDMATNLVNLDIVNNPVGISSTLTSKFNKVADNLKNISNEFGNLFVSSSDSYSYNGDSMNYNDSLALRAGILSLASQLKNISAYKWGEDKDFSVKTYTKGSDTYEYLELDVNPAKFLNEGNFFALDSNSASARLPEVKQNLIEASSLLLNLPVGYEEITQEDLDEVNAINLALRGISTYKISFENDEELKEVEIDLAKMFDVNYAIDISSFGSSWQNLCNIENSVMISAEEAMENGYLECKLTYTYYDGYNTYSHYYYLGADVEPQVLATSQSSSIDDIVKTITKIDDTILSGQAIIDYIAENQGIEAFNRTFTNVKSDDRYLVSGNNASYNQYLGSIGIKAYKSNGADSRAEIKERFSVAKSEISSNVELVSIDSQKDLTYGAVGRASVISHMENINTNGDNLYVRVSFEVDAIKYYISKYDSSWENEVELYKGTIVSDITTINEEAMFYLGEPKFNVRIAIDENDVILNVARLSAKAVVETYSEVVKTIDGADDLGIDAIRFNSEVRLSNFDEDVYNNVKNQTIFRVYGLDTINLQKIETLSFAQLTSDKFIAIGDDYYDIITYANNKLNFEMYEYDNETSSYVKQEEGEEIPVTPSSTDNKVANYVDASSGEEGVLTLIKSIKLDGYDDLYKTTASIEVTKQGNVEDWNRWDWSNPTYWHENVENAIVDANSLELAFTALNPNWTYSDKYGQVMLNSNGDVVKATQDGFWESGDAKYIRTETKVGQWTKDSVNNQLVLTLDKEIIKIRVVQDGNDYFIENSNTLQVGFVFEEHFISGTSLDSFIKEQF